MYFGSSGASYDGLCDVRGLDFPTESFFYSGSKCIKVIRVTGVETTILISNH